MGSMLHPSDRKQIIERLNTLQPSDQPKWGSMTAASFLAHIIDAFQVTFKEKDVSIKKGFLSSRFGRWLILKFPIPKGKIKAPSIFHETKAGDFNEDRASVLAYIDRMAQDQEQNWGPSPLFGHMSPKQWAQLHHTHLDHHLKQFGR